MPKKKKDSCSRLSKGVLHELRVVTKNKYLMVLFSFWKVLRKEKKKNVKENDFLIFDCLMKKYKKNKNKK